MATKINNNQPVVTKNSNSNNAAAIISLQQKTVTVNGWNLKNNDGDKSSYY